MAAFVGGGGGYLSLHDDAVSLVAARLLPQTGPSAAVNNWVYYADCDAARTVGRAPIKAGEPGYRAELDADNDGNACEPYPGHRSHRRKARSHF